jgi:hypothetical protein
MKNLIKTVNEKTFYDLVNKYLKSSAFIMKRDNDRLQFVFKSKSKETEITVYCDLDEFTVGIGEYYHTHFNIDSSDKESELDKYINAGENAIGFIQAFMRNEIWLEVSFRDDKAIGASICDEHDSYSVMLPVDTKKEDSKVEEKIFRWEK